MKNLLLFVFILFLNSSIYGQGHYSQYFIDSNGAQMKITLYYYKGQGNYLTKKEYKVQNDTMFVDLYWWKGKNVTLLGAYIDTVILLNKSEYHNLCSIQMTSWEDYNLIDTVYNHYNDTLFVWFKDIYPTTNCKPLALNQVPVISSAIYPNPFTDKLFLKEEPFLISNLQGVTMPIVYENGVLDTRLYPNGFYFIRTKESVWKVLKE